MNRTILTALTVLFAITTTVAQSDSDNGKGNKRHRAEKRELKAEMRKWFEADVLPSLQAWHKEYDASLTAEDLSALNQLRAQAKQLRASARQSKNLRESTHEEMKKIMEAVKPIAKRSREKLMEIYDRNEDKIEAWRDEARTKMQAYCEEHNIDNGMEGQRGMWPFGEMGMFSGGRKAAVRFILWDGSMPPEGEMFGGPKSFDSQSELGRVTVAPNPSGSSAAVNMDGLANGPATVEVFDMNGVRKSSQQISVSGGTLNTTIPTTDLGPGTYMVSVSTATGRKTTTFIVNR